MYKTHKVQGRVICVNKHTPLYLLLSSLFICSFCVYITFQDIICTFYANLIYLYSSLIYCILEKVLLYQIQGVIKCQKKSVFLIIAIVLTSVLPAGISTVQAVDAVFIDAGDTQKYDFEDDTAQGWTVSGDVKYIKI